MKHLLLPALLLFPLVSAAQHTMRMPRFLRPGDKIAVISPSSTPDTLTVKRGCQTLREWGYEPVVGRHALSHYHGFAGTADERAADLLWALRDTTISAIICTRGGDGAMQVLQRIAPDEMGRNAKWIIGFSDATALHSAAVAAGTMSIHGSMCHAISSMGGRDTVSVTLRRMLEGQLPTYHVARHEHDQQGHATGMLVGGNMSVFSALAGSAYDFLSVDADLILFIEDKGEGMTKIERLFHQIEIRGLMPKVKGVIVGRFSDYKHPENGFSDMYDMLHEYLRHYRIPVCYGFPVGHARLNNFPLIEGCQVRLSVGSQGSTLQFIK
jgi:muramoyltetrapeptide carboxypeptidase